MGINLKSLTAHYFKNFFVGGVNSLKKVHSTRAIICFATQHICVLHFLQQNTYYNRVDRTVYAVSKCAHHKMDDLFLRV